MKPNFQNNNLKIAIQKNGRLTADTLLFLKKAGLEIDTDGQKLYAKCWNYPLDIIFVRDDDIPDFVQNKSVDLGIVGENVLYEKNACVESEMKFNFGLCSLVVAVPRDSQIFNEADFQDKTIATSYPLTVAKYFKEKNIKVTIVKVTGSVELSPALGLSAGIADLSSTGSTLAISDLRTIAKIYDFQAVLIARKDGNIKKIELIKKLIFRFQSVLTAQKYKYVMMNAPKNKLKQIIQIAPGLKSPTISSLAKQDWISIQTVIEEDVFWEKVSKIKDAGASGIIVLPIEKIII